LRRAVTKAAAGGRAAYLCSYPKTGRTWFRFMLSTYIDLALECGIGVDLTSMFSVLPNLSTHRLRGISKFRLRGDARAPLVLASHLPYEPYLFEVDNDVVFILRDVRDVVVSSYFHATRQRRQAERYHGEIDEFIADPHKGVSRFVRYHNSWANALTRHRALVLTYEGMKSDPVSTLASAARFLDLPIVDTAVATAVKRADFSRMQALEQRSGIEGQQYDPSAPESRRMRRGEVGGYHRYLSADGIAEIARRCREELSPGARRLFEQHGLEI
jgi:hypothetical protein